PHVLGQDRRLVPWGREGRRTLPSHHDETLRGLRGQAFQPQESSDGLFQLGSARCQRPNQVDSPRQDSLHDPACSYLRTAYFDTDSRASSGGSPESRSRWNTARSKSRYSAWPGNGVTFASRAARRSRTSNSAALWNTPFEPSARSGKWTSARAT